MRKHFIIIIAVINTLVGIGNNIKAESPISDTIYYEHALDSLVLMLEGTASISFKKAVFISENAFFCDTLDYSLFNKRIEFLTKLSQMVAESKVIMYDEPDKEKVEKYGAVFKVFTDTVQFYVTDTTIYSHFPFHYNFEDIWGENDWSDMFVSKLLETGKGNCHSMPFLYKIVCNELGEEAYLSLAPLHMYIKLQSKKWGWYNTELTNGSFPIDAWLMASGYIHLTAIQNGIYMDTLSLKESVAYCIFDLAKGYEKKFGVRDGVYILRCCETALEYFPGFINALLLKAETMKTILFDEAKKHGASKPEDIFYIDGVKDFYNEMESTYIQIHTLGYRQMPEEMYLDWMESLKNNMELYQNKKILNVQ